MYVFQLSFEKQKLLMEILDANDSWRDLATEIKISLDLVNKLQGHAEKGHSPTQEVLLAYSARGHTVEQLFRVLAKYKHFRAMAVLLDLVPDNCKSIYERLKPSAVRDGPSCSSISRVPDLPSGSGSVPPDQGVPSGYGSEQASNNGTGQGSKACSRHGSLSNQHHGRQSRTDQGTSATQDTAKAAGLHNTLTVPYEELRDATDNFSPNSVIGKGGYGVVYKATWKHMDVAVKRIISKTRARSPHDQAAQIDDEQLRQSLKELRALALFRHDNILPLYGYSLEGPEPCLIYQFMASGSLEDRLQCRNNTDPLNWDSRRRIILGAARGLHFLHTASFDEQKRPRPLIHGDVKSANILLDAHFEPKLGDFGLCRSGQVAVPSGAPPLIASHIRGTLAYLPPEFIHKKHLSYHLDVFSFGVVLYEAATGLKAYSEQRKPNSKLVDHMNKCLEESSLFRKMELKSLSKLGLDASPEEKEKMSSLMELADEWAGSLDVPLFFTFLKLGQLSTRKDPQERITTSEILDTLS